MAENLISCNSHKLKQKEGLDKLDRLRKILHGMYNKYVLFPGCFLLYVKIKPMGYVTHILRLRGPNRAVIIHFRWKKAWFVPEIYDIPHQGHKSIRKASKQGHMFIFTVGGGQGGELFVRRPMGRVCTCLMATVYQAVTIGM
ncbi:hypothetical protein R3W88_003605 [Solanum pinnatisectum]|uniref:Uncharacterized protein n=1 Tax=Solanum pinnatisectum TaxID=50273 RepID=A0AAV9MQ29_9SOLN|nr:hypothetical protein R3W88_003605 [Solanum pinnatisectum]